MHSHTWLEISKQLEIYLTLICAGIRHCLLAFVVWHPIADVVIICALVSLNMIYDLIYYCISLACWRWKYKPVRWQTPAAGVWHHNYYCNCVCRRQKYQPYCTLWTLPADVTSTCSIVFDVKLNTSIDRIGQRFLTLKEWGKSLQQIGIYSIFKCQYLRSALE
jgi:hypothetical protein